MRPRRRGSLIASRVPSSVAISTFQNRGRGAPAAVDLERAGHPEVEQGPGPAVELHPQVLALPAHGHDAPAAQGRGEAGGRDPVVDDRVADDRHRGDAAAAQGPLGPAAGGLDLGELGHAGRG